MYTQFSDHNVHAKMPSTCFIISKNTLSYSPIIMSKSSRKSRTFPRKTKESFFYIMVIGEVIFRKIFPSLLHNYNNPTFFEVLSNYSYYFSTGKSKGLFNFYDLAGTGENAVKQHIRIRIFCEFHKNPQCQFHNHIAILDNVKSKSKGG